MTTPRFKRLNPLIDSDSLVFRGGFSADSQAKDRFGDPEYLEADYKAWALANVRTTISYILDDVFSECDYYRCFIGGSSNFRDHVGNALIKVGPPSSDGSLWEYKGNRKDARRPKYYHEIREYLVDFWQAEVTEGCEADDAVAMLQWQAKDKSTVIVRQDKDLEMIPGYHYNWVTKEFKYINLHQANLFFWKQMIEGDRVDHIPGIPGMGIKRSEKLIHETCKGEVGRVRVEVEKLYKTHYGRLWRDVFNESADLLWIKREPDKTWRDTFGA